MNIKLSDRVYDFLKWTCLIALPACSVAYTALSSIWGWGYAVEVSSTVAAVCAFLGTIIGVSDKNKEEVEEDE